MWENRAWALGGMEFEALFRTPPPSANPGPFIKANISSGIIIGDTQPLADVTDFLGTHTKRISSGRANQGLPALWKIPT
jgi:hypothetical protein